MNLDRSHDFLGTRGRGLEPFFEPRRIAVVGASDRDGSPGKIVFQNLRGNPSEIPIIPINTTRAEVGGVPAHPDLLRAPGPIDLAVIITPAVTVPDVVGQCAQAGIPAAIVISAGFRETGEAGERLELEVKERAAGKVRIIGPNCMGLMNPRLGLNATFAGLLARPGSLAFLSQSGAMCSAILDWSLQVNVGFSGFVSTGSMLDVGFGDLIDYFGDDPATAAILLYMETVGDARSFLSAAREVALSKPIIAIKAGRSHEAVKAVSSHTGTLAGSDAVLDAAFRRAGVQRVDSIEELFSLADALGKQPRPKGSSLTVVTNAGGPGVLAVDALMASGGKLAPLSAPTVQALDAFLPPHWSRNNPIDVIGDADPERFVRAVQVALNDPGNDGVLAILTQQAMTDPTATAAGLAKLEKKGDKPLLASWMGGAGMAEGVAALHRSGIPVFPFPDLAARVFNHMAAHEINLRALYETPRLPVDDGKSLGFQVEDILEAVEKSGRTLLSESESKQVLSAWGVPVIETWVVESEDEAARRAETCGYPVVLKLHSETLTHKTDVGGVRLDLRDESQVRAAFRAIRDAVEKKAGPGHFQGVSVQRMIRERGVELILGGNVDPQFGPVILFGWGGTWVEVLNDTSLDLPPLNTHLAGLLMGRTRAMRALQGARGAAPVDLPALQDVLVRFSRIMVEHPRIHSIDVNPFLVSDRIQAALDARILLHPPTGASSRPPPRPAIRAYPAQYAGEFDLSDGRKLWLRPIRPEDEPMLVRFHGRLSAQTVYNRYFQEMRLDQRAAHQRLIRVCCVDYDRNIALVAEIKSDAGQTEVVAAARLTRNRDGESAELSVLVEDGFQAKGLGREMVRRLLRVAEDEHIRKVTAYILGTNVPMQKLCAGLGFQMRSQEFGKSVTAEIRPPLQQHPLQSRAP